MRVSETQFADDAALYTTSWDSFESTTVGFVKVASEWGLTVSTEKTKGMVAGQILDERNVRSMQVERGSLDVVSHLGANISSDGEVTREIDCRVAKAARAFGCLRRPIFQDRCCHQKTSLSSSGCVSPTVQCGNLDIEGSAC